MKNGISGLLLLSLVVSLATGSGTQSFASESTSVSAADELTYARKAVELKKVDNRLMNDLVAVLKANPNNAEAHALLGQCYDMIGMRELAKEQYAIANTLDPRLAAQTLVRFKDTFQNGDPADGFTDWVQIRKHFPYDPDVRAYETAIAEIFTTVASAELAYLAEKSHGHNLRGIDAMLSATASRNGECVRALKLADLELVKHISDDGLFAKAMALNGLHLYQRAAASAWMEFGRNYYYPGVGRELVIAYSHLNAHKSAIKPAIMNLIVWVQDSEKVRAKELLADVLQHVPPAEARAELDKSIEPLQKTNFMGTINSAVAQALVNINRRSDGLDFLKRGAASNQLDDTGWMMYGDYLEQLHDLKGAKDAYMCAGVENCDNKQYAAAIERISRKQLNQENDLALRLKEIMRGNGKNRGIAAN